MASIASDTKTSPRAGEAAATAGPRWRDHKRYAWLLGLIVPTLPFLAWGLVELTGSASSGSTGRCSCSGSFRCSTSLVGMDAANPPDSVIKWLEQDRYYRWCTYLYIPIQYAGLVLRLLAVVEGETRAWSTTSAWR